MKNGISPASLLRDKVLEEELIRLGLAEVQNDIDAPAGHWNFMKIKRSRIDRSLSMKNQARLDQSLISDLLSRIEQAMLQGKKLPAIVVAPIPGTDMFVNCDGNHRYEKSGDYEYVNVYAVHFPNADMQRHFTNTANDRHGEGNGAEVKISHAATEVESYGMSVDAAAKLYNVSRSLLREEMNLRKFQAAFGKIPKAGTLHETVKKALGEAIQQVTLVVANEMVKSAVDSPGINANQIRAFSDSYKKCTTADEQKAMLADIPNRFVVCVKQKTQGGVLPVKGSGKKVLTKNDLLVKVDRMLSVLRLPKNNIYQSLSPEEVTRVSVLHKELGDLLAGGSGKKPVLG